MRPLFQFPLLCSALLLSLGFSGAVLAEQPDFAKQVEPLLIHYCYDCHGDGADKGDFDFEAIVDPKKWQYSQSHWKVVWENLRGSIMPPSDEEQPTPEEKALITEWIEKQIFRLDAQKPDPGRVTLRRLNRREYHYAVKDLFEIEYKADENFPPDDTGFGFDTISDVLTLSPLLMQKYLAAAETIASKAVPNEQARIPRVYLKPEHFTRVDDPNHKSGLTWLSFKHPTTYQRKQWIEHSGRYRVRVEFKVEGSPEATENTGDIILRVGDREIGRSTYGWDNREKIYFTKEVDLQRGDHELFFLTEKGRDAEQGQDWVYGVADHVLIEGPLNGEVLEYSRESQRIFPDGVPQPTVESRREFASKAIARIARRAFRRPVDEGIQNKLMALYRAGAEVEGGSFEEGVRFAITGILSSPRFLFRSEAQPRPDDPAEVVKLDQFAFASRLSFFLWSSIPDEELLDLAAKGELEKDLSNQVSRLLKDDRSMRFVRGFVGQWLGTSDVPGMTIDARRFLGKESSRDADRIFSYDLRTSMKNETEYLFRYLLSENRPATELLTADYSFLNDLLAKFYQLDEIKGRNMQKVSFPKGSPRGGLLTHGSFLVTTSNPTRTSPVKRGLFILDNLLGTPAPPAPPNVPELEEVLHEHKNKQPSMRELMEIHRQKPLCKSCHARMDPLGLALESFDPLGQFLTMDAQGRPIQTAGQLMTGEKFSDVQSLQDVLAGDRKVDFYRCLCEKVLTYALGRGVDYYDAPTIDRMVEELLTEPEHGGMRSLIYKTVWSFPFRYRRGDGDRLASDR